MWRKGNPLVLSVEMRMVQPLWRTVRSFLKKVKIELSYDLAIALAIYTKDTKTLIQRDKSTPMCIAALSTTAKLWKELKCPLTDKWIKKMWYIYTTEYYSTIKTNEILPIARMVM